ncbi:hypothetical protein DFH07DRAFT_327087 [Mycena maculata]|uniref:Uncharacterized protein n=1 Tax=Mycena maculata TaxID=230809 RepID=A0AAD7NMM2_9AGAR|nr:hypothetical protein DFH07DRAFT_327087 [Mycena maculata]
MKPSKYLLSFDCGFRARVPISAEPHLPRLTKTKSRRRRIVSTLTPALLTERDHLDLSGIQWVNLSFPRTVGPGFKFFYERGVRQFTPFTPHARGFFYFGPRPGLPPLAASIRFRCTPTAHPSSFDDGYDLLLTDGLPWQWLPAQAAGSASPVLRDQLVHEGHLTLDAIAKWRKRFGWVEGSKTHLSPSNFLFALEQLFAVDFGRQTIAPLIVGEDDIYPAKMGYIFADQSRGSVYCPFKGSALVHFEQSPTAPHIIHLRIAQIVTPVVATDDAGQSRIVLPRAGTLFSVRKWDSARRAYFAGDGEPWAFDLRTGSAAAEALGILVGNG